MSTRDELLANVAEALHDGGPYREIRDQIDRYAAAGAGERAPPAVWCVWVPTDCDCVPLGGDHLRSAHASEASALAEAARTNRQEGRRDESVQAWVSRLGVLP